MDHKDGVNLVKEKFKREKAVRPALYLSLESAAAIRFTNNINTHTIAYKFFAKPKQLRKNK